MRSAAHDKLRENQIRFRLGELESIHYYRPSAECRGARRWNQEVLASLCNRR